MADEVLPKHFALSWFVDPNQVWQVPSNMVRLQFVIVLNLCLVFGAFSLSNGTFAYCLANF